MYALHSPVFCFSIACPLTSRGSRRDAVWNRHVFFFFSFLLRVITRVISGLPWTELPFPNHELKIMTQENNRPPSSQIQHQPLIPSSPNNEHAGSKRTAYKIIAQCFITNICMEIGTSLIIIPLNPILESIICRNVFADVSGDVDPRCRSALVQGELSFIRGWQMTFEIIPGLLTAIPYTLMANRYGRPRVLSLAVLGGSLALGFVVFICIFIHKKGPSTRYDELTRPAGFFHSVFSPRLIWLGSTFTVIGGGAPVFNSMSFAMLGEATNERQR